MRSKRRAPPPPPLPPKGEALKAAAARQSSATAPGPMTTSTSSSHQQPSSQDYITFGADSDADADVSLAGGDEGEYRSKICGGPPPRPPPPKFDTACGPLTDYEKVGLRHAERQYQMEHGIGLPPTPKVHVSLLT